MGVLRTGVRTCVVAIATALLFAVPAGAGTGVVTTKADEFNPAASAGYVVWNVTTKNGYVVYARPTGGARFRVNPVGTSAWVGGIDTDGTTLIYHQWVANKRSDIFTFNLGTKTRSKIGKPVSTGRWEYGGTGSGGWILFARWFRSKDRSLLLYNTTTHEMRHLDATSGGHRVLQPGQVAGNYAVWEKGAYTSGRYTSCNVFLYDIAAGTTTRIANPNERCQAGPSVTPAGTVYYGRDGFRCGRHAVLRKQVLGGAASTLIKFAAGHDFYSSYALDNGDTTTDLYYDPWKCGTQTNVLKMTDP